MPILPHSSLRRLSSTRLSHFKNGTEAFPFADHGYKSSCCYLYSSAWFYILLLVLACIRWTRSLSCCVVVSSTRRPHASRKPCTIRQLSSKCLVYLVAAGCVAALNSHHTLAWLKSSTFAAVTRISVSHLKIYSSLAEILFRLYLNGVLYFLSGQVDYFSVPISASGIVTFLLESTIVNFLFIGSAAFILVRFVVYSRSFWFIFLHFFTTPCTACSALLLSWLRPHRSSRRRHRPASSPPSATPLSSSSATPWSTARSSRKTVRSPIPACS